MNFTNLVKSLLKDTRLGVKEDTRAAANEEIIQSPTLDFDPVECPELCLYDPNNILCRARSAGINI